MQNGKPEKAKAAKGGVRYVLGLFFLAPLVGEFLLGNLPITWLWVLLVLAPMYGGGAILIRETVRRFGWGWPSMIVLGLAYALVEEAFVTQSLFNPNYVGLRLLDYGYIESLGIGSWWTVFVLGIHTIWSTATPIALMEVVSGEKRRRPWLGKLGYSVTVAVFALGCFASAAAPEGEPFRATNAQFLWSGISVAILVALAVALGRAEKRRAAEPPSTAADRRGLIAIAGSTFALGSAFMVLAVINMAIPAWANVAGMLLIVVTASALLWKQGIDGVDGMRRELAAASGFLAVYMWYGFAQAPSVGEITPAIDAIGNGLFTLAAVALLIFAWRRTAISTELAASA